MINLNDPNKKQGVLDSLQLILASKKRPIKLKNNDGQLPNDGNSDQLKMPNNVEIIDVDIEDKENGEEESQEEKENRLAQAETDTAPEVMTRDLKTMENEKQQVEKARASKKEHEEMAKHVKEIKDKQKLISSGKFLLDYKWFYKDLENAINDQVEQSNRWEDSYDSFNATYAASGVLMPGERRAERKIKPIINVYFDLSGSLSNSSIAKAKESLSFLTDLEASGDIESYTVYYFKDNVSSNPEEVHGCTGAFPVILEHIKVTGADNVIIFTDADFESQSGNLDDLPYVKIDGCMWWMWDHQLMARKAWKHLVSSNPNATYHYNLR